MSLLYITFFLSIFYDVSLFCISIFSTVTALLYLNKYLEVFALTIFSLRMALALRGPSNLYLS